MHAALTVAVVVSPGAPPVVVVVDLVTVVVAGPLLEDVVLLKAPEMSGPMLRVGAFADCVLKVGPPCCALQAVVCTAATRRPAHLLWQC